MREGLGRVDVIKQIQADKKQASPDFSSRKLPDKTGNLAQRGGYSLGYFCVNPFRD